MSDTSALAFFPSGVGASSHLIRVDRLFDSSRSLVVSARKKSILEENPNHRPLFISLPLLKECHLVTSHDEFLIILREVSDYLMNQEEDISVHSHTRQDAIYCETFHLMDIIVINIRGVNKTSEIFVSVKRKNVLLLRNPQRGDLVDAVFFQ